MPDIVFRKFIAIDPGISTGFTVINAKLLMACGVISTPHNNVMELMNLLEVVDPDVIVIEDFILRAKRKAQEHADTCKNIGAVMGWATLHSKLMEFQIPSYRKAFVSIAKAIVPRGTSIHTIDSLAHALAWHKRNNTNIVGTVNPVQYVSYSDDIRHIDASQFNQNLLKEY